LDDAADFAGLEALEAFDGFAGLEAFADLVALADLVVEDRLAGRRMVLGGMVWRPLWVVRFGCAWTRRPCMEVRARAGR
jgi:hypothetical protein